MICEFFGIDGDVADVRFHCGDRISDRRNPGNVPHGIEPVPAFGAIVGNENVDGLGAGVKRVGIMGIEGQAAHFAWAAFAVAGFFPSRAEIFAHPNAVAAGTGENFVRRFGRHGHLGNRPLLERRDVLVSSYGRLRFSASRHLHQYDIKDRSHGFTLPDLMGYIYYSAVRWTRRNSRTPFNSIPFKRRSDDVTLESKGPISCQRASLTPACCNTERINFVCSSRNGPSSPLLMNTSST